MDEPKVVNHSQKPWMAFQNPVYTHECADPFVLKYCGEYWCYSTGIQPDERAFKILHSPDLVHWQAVGSALDLLPEAGSCYWAPEVVYSNGIFYLYYAVGDEEHMHIRVATATQPYGPFIDSGARLTQEQFAIDAHILIDKDGAWYLFYATDYLDHTRIGTGTAMDRMLDPFTLSHHPRPVTRARYDWQIYDPQRAAKQGVCWHTIEGPFVLAHAGKYYQMFSGGNWQNASYGLGYAVTDRLDNPDEWGQCCDGEKRPQILVSNLGRGIIGPGHNSVVRGPDNRSLYCVYHRWQPESHERVLAIDRLGWQNDQLVIDDPARTGKWLQLPQISGFGSAQQTAGKLTVKNGVATLIPDQTLAEGMLPLPGEDWVMEVSLRAIEVGKDGVLGLHLSGKGSTQLKIDLHVHKGLTRLKISQGVLLYGYPMPDYNPAAFHLFRVEMQKGQAIISLDGNLLQENDLVHYQFSQGMLFQQAILYTFNLPAEFAGLAVS